MNILIANDDGINARGIHELAKALSRVADIYISGDFVKNPQKGKRMVALCIFRMEDSQLMRRI